MPKRVFAGEKIWSLLYLFILNYIQITDYETEKSKVDPCVHTFIHTHILRRVKYPVCVI